MLIGPDASAAEVAERRAAIAANPAGWVAQEVVALSSHPTFDGHQLQPRHVDLRAFVYLRGTAAEDCTLADLALTRVAPEGSLVVNSSRGGGARTPGSSASRSADAPSPTRDGDTSDACADWRRDPVRRRGRADVGGVRADHRPAGPPRPGRLRASGRAGRSRSGHRRLSIIDLSRGRVAADGRLRRSA